MLMVCSMSLQMLREEPCLLYTKDIQRGWIHLHIGGDLHLVPRMNRKIPRYVGWWVEEGVLVRLCVCP